MNELQWQFKNGLNTTEFQTFPLAFRTMFNLVKESIENKKPVDTSKFLIVGPKNPRGERNKYNYQQANELAATFDLVQDGYINGKEFKKKKF
jgi:hypothetical protein